MVPMSVGSSDREGGLVESAIGTFGGTTGAGG
jgi:hypothetical protein